MLQIQNICKEYKTGSLIQKALDGVDLNLRDNEFVAVLGPSGSGKTTLLNIIGGLDRYDSGNLIINGVSTKKYKDRDWDSYRNHTIGFVFQSYNLIPHQTVLANVELALTISGVSGAERKKRAKEALEKVGLGDQVHKKPNQLSGGQMQRVAIARALVNNPDILLADEPTGALDSETSIQVMELLKEVAKDRLVVMVTHNPELAEQYATRIVKLKDGRIYGDTDPFEPALQEKEPVHASFGKAAMSFLTALTLSFNNLLTKKTRTLLVAFAGSIGIIGIALILSLSNGVDHYIQTTEENTMSEYPLEIDRAAMNMTSMMLNMQNPAKDKEADSEKEVREVKLAASMLGTVGENDLRSLSNYLKSGECDIDQYAKNIQYLYNINPLIYTESEAGDIRKVNPTTVLEEMGMAGVQSYAMISGSMFNSFKELPEDSALYTESYELKAGHWPESYHELVLMLGPDGTISDTALYHMGIKDPTELDSMLRAYKEGKGTKVDENRLEFNYADFLGLSFKLVNASECYVYDKQYGLWRDKTSDTSYMKKLVQNGETLTIVGVVQQNDESTMGGGSMPGVGYTTDLTYHVIELAERSEAVKAQLEDPEKDIFTGKRFDDTTKPAEFSMESLFTIDQEAMKKAFEIDEEQLGLDPSAFSGMDLSGVDLSGIDFGSMIDTNALMSSIPTLTEKDLMDLMKGVKITVTEESLKSSFDSLLNGFQEYTKNDPSADISSLEEAVTDYLKSPEAGQIMAEQIQKILTENSDSILTVDDLTQMVTELVQAYQDYVTAEALDPKDFAENFEAFLQTEEAKAILLKTQTTIADSIAGIRISEEQMDEFSKALSEGYAAYAKENNKPTPGGISEAFTKYMSTPEAQAIMEEAAKDMVDTKQLETNVNALMQKVGGEFATALQQQLGNAVGGVMQTIMSRVSGQMQNAMANAMQSLSENMSSAFSMDPKVFAGAIKMNMTEQELKELMMALMSNASTSYNGNLETLGYADLLDPYKIMIYPKDFKSKAKIVEILDGYNERCEAAGETEKIISYTDLVGTLMSSVTTIVDIIGYVLIAFVSISLIVSSIMIGVITYISVLERRKEIGILRAMGASKHNIAQVFNAETIITGLLAGLIGVGLSALLIIPGNAILHHVIGRNDVSAILLPQAAVILVILSVILTMIGGLIPSKKASRSDPVTALRSE